MSNSALALAFATDLPGVDKNVLVALADCADDRKGQTCWPSIAHLVKKSGWSERAVQKAILNLEKGGHISRLARPGHGVIYTIHPRTTCTPAQDAPPQDSAPTPAPRAPNPLGTSIPPQPSGCAPKGADRSQKRASKREEKRGSRISIDWQPDALPSPLGEAVEAQGEAWRTRELARFRDYWSAMAGPKAFSADWQARWRRWLDDGLDKVGKALPVSPKPAPKAEIVRAIGDGLDGFRGHLANEIGPATYGAWLEPGSIIPNGKGVIIQARSDFAVDHIRSNFMPGIEAAARRAGVDPGAIAIAAGGKVASASGATI